MTVNYWVCRNACTEKEKGDVYGTPPPSLKLAELKKKSKIINTGYLKGGMASFYTWRIEILYINEKLLINKTISSVCLWVFCFGEWGSSKALGKVLFIYIWQIHKSNM